MARLLRSVFWAARSREQRFLLGLHQDITRNHRPTIIHMRRQLTLSHRRRPITTRRQLPRIMLRCRTTAHNTTAPNTTVHSTTTAATEHGRSIGVERAGLTLRSHGAAQPRIEHVADAVAQEVEGEHSDRDRSTRNQHEPPWRDEAGVK